MNTDKTLDSPWERLQYLLGMHNIELRSLLNEMGYTSYIDPDTIKRHIITSKHFLTALSIKFPTLSLLWLVHGIGGIIDTGSTIYSLKKRIPCPIRPDAQSQPNESLEQENARLKLELSKLRAQNGK